jgi:hypothetical protein
MKKEKAPIFLHERKQKQKEYKAKGRISEYHKERYVESLKKEKERDCNSFVTKCNYELVMGFKMDNIYGDYKGVRNKLVKKYFSKFGLYKGTHETRQVR